MFEKDEFFIISFQSFLFNKCEIKCNDNKTEMVQTRP